MGLSVGLHIYLFCQGVSFLEEVLLYIVTLHTQPFENRAPVLRTNDLKLE